MNDQDSFCSELYRKCQTLITTYYRHVSWSLSQSARPMNVGCRGRFNFPITDILYRNTFSSRESSKNSLSSHWPLLHHGCSSYQLHLILLRPDDISSISITRPLNNHLTYPLSYIPSIGNSPLMAPPTKDEQIHS